MLEAFFWHVYSRMNGNHVPFVTLMFTSTSFTCPKRGRRNWWFKRAFCKVKKTQHQNSEFGPCKKYISLQGRGETQKCTNFFVVKTEFHPVLTSSFLFPERLHSCCCCIYFHCSYLYNYYNYLEPCELDAEFQHFIPRFNETSLLWGPHSKTQ